MTNIKTMMEEMAQEELERDGAACREVMQSRKGAGAHGKMRLIDADALIFDLQHCGCVTVFGKMLVSAATHRINLQPTVDAAPVVHGRLIETGEDEEYTFYGNCSVCGADNRMYHNYCCNCGARMDGGKNDGYCPCAIWRNEDTLCPCLEFREMTVGVCNCGRYMKVNDKKEE